MINKSKVLGFVVSLAAILLSVPSFAVADRDTDKGMDEEGRGMMQSEYRMEKEMDKMMGTTTESHVDDVDDADENEGIDDMDEMMSKGHRSKVAEAVLKLVELAGKDKNIGEEISQVAKEEDESSEKVAEAIKEVENRGKFKTFLIGTDYKNIGAIRSEIVRSDNNIDRLAKAKERTLDPILKAELDVQVAALQKANDDAEAFVKANESKFSIFGWLVKIFNS